MDPRSIVITGASSGIGAALAVALAGAGRHLLLIARDRDRLEEIAQRVRSSGARATVEAADITDAAAIAAILQRFDQAVPVDWVVANAGISAGTAPDGRPEGGADAARVIETNLIGAINTVQPLLPAMCLRRRGHLILMSSLAAWRPLPDMPSYGASKAGLRAYGVALRGALSPHGVGVSVVCPGFVTTPMSARHKGAKPFELSADRAASAIMRGVAAKRSTIAFPWPLALITRLDAVLPPALSDWLVRGFASRIEPARPRITAQAE